MIPLFLLLAAGVGPQGPVDTHLVQRFDDCVALTRSDPEKAVATADKWRINGGGLPARQCLGLAYAAQEKWPEAAASFEQAAREAEIQRDGRAADMWVMAANAALAGDDGAAARGYLDHALALPVLTPTMRGEAYLDRARAQVAVGNLPGARDDLDQALKLVPKDPMAWLLSATLARRQNDKLRAGKDIAEAQRLAPGEEAILSESQAIEDMGKPAPAQPAPPK